MFYVGQKLSNRSIGDSNCIFSAEVKKVSEKSIVIDYDGRIKRCKIHYTNDGQPFIFPEGKYSMCPIFRDTSFNRGD